MHPGDPGGHGGKQVSSGSLSLVGQKDKPRATGICCGACGDHAQALMGPGQGVGGGRGGVP